METYYFSASQMTVGYDGKPLIKDITLNVKKGEILTLIGPNGAGKSTILKSIIGQLSLIAGTVLLDGESIERMEAAELAKKMSVVLTEQVRTELMTCEDVVETGRYPYTGRLGVLSEKDHAVVWEAMELTRTTALAKKDFHSVSDGERQRVMLARAIAQEPEILVLDEPTSYLDIRYKLEFLSILQEMAKTKKRTVIMSLHELDLAERVSDRVLCVKGAYAGRFGTPEEVFTPGYMSELYDIMEGTFDEASGRAELPRVTGKPEVFVIAGGGNGASVYRRLQREKIPFSTGILWKNDIDYPVACALAAKVIAEEAFETAAAETIAAAKREIDQCGWVLCLFSDFGAFNQADRELFLYAKSLGKSVEGELPWQK